MDGPHRGLLLSCSSALGNTACDFVKKNVSKHVQPLEAVFWMALLEGIAALSYFGSNHEWPELSDEFWYITVCSGSFNLLGAVLYVQALQVSSVSVAVPYLAFSPVIQIFVSWAHLGEVPTTQGLLGLSIVTSGGVLLGVAESKITKGQDRELVPTNNQHGDRVKITVEEVLSRPQASKTTKALSRVTSEMEMDSINGGFESSPNDSEEDKTTKVGPAPRGWLSSLKEFTPPKAGVLMITVCVVWSVAASLDKVALGEVDTMFYLGAQRNIIALGAGIGCLYAQPAGLIRSLRFSHWLVAGAFVEGFTICALYLAIDEMFISYVIAIKRGGGVLLSVIMGAAFLGEKNLGKRLPAVLVMVGGVMVIVLS